MRRLSLLLGLFALGCGAGDQEGADAAADAPADVAADAPAMPAGITLADVAGTWNMASTADTVSVPYVMMASEDDAGWTVTFPGRDPVPVEVLLMDGDSIVTATGPFESVVHDGEMVTTRSVMRLQDGMLIGTFTATYENPDIADLSGTSEGTRAMD